MNNLSMDCKSLPERYIDPTGYRPHWYSNPGNEGSGGGSLMLRSKEKWAIMALTTKVVLVLEKEEMPVLGEGGNASSGSYYYDWDDEVYRDSFTNEKVEFSQVYTNFVQPNSTGYSFDYDYGFEKVISSISFNSDEGEYGIDRLTLKIEYKNALVLKLVLKKPMLPIQDQNGGGDGVFDRNINSNVWFKWYCTIMGAVQYWSASWGDFAGSSGKAASKLIGKTNIVLNLAGTAGGTIDLVNNWESAGNGDIAKVGVDVAITVITTALYFSGVGTPVAIVLTGIQIANSYGAFDSIYSSMNE
jgi:hypothetical protein